MTQDSIWALAYLILFGSFIGFSLFSWLLQNATASLANTYAYVCPVISLLLGTLLLDEEMSGLQLLFGLMILLGVALMVSAPAPTPAERAKSQS